MKGIGLPIGDEQNFLFEGLSSSYFSRNLVKTCDKDQSLKSSIQFSMGGM